MREWMTHERHPLSAAYPDMQPDDLEALADSIAEHGLMEPIVLMDGMVLDGWHRYRACSLAQVEPRFVQYDGNDPQAYVIAKNGHRRHLTASQRAIAAVKVYEWHRHGGDRKSDQAATLPLDPDDQRKTDAELAELARVGDRTIRDAKVAEKAGKGDEVRDGKVSASKAAKDARAENHPPKPKPPTAIERLEADLETSLETIKELRQAVEELTAELKSFENASDGEKEQAFKFGQLRREIVALKSQRDDMQTQLAAEKRARQALERKLASMVA